MAVELPALDPLLAEYRTLLVARFAEQLVQLKLFGAHARGEALPGANVDVAVVLEHIRGPADRMLPLELAGELAEEYDLAIAPIVLSLTELEFMRKHGDPLTAQLDREGIEF